MSGLVLHSLKGKKNWFLLSFAIVIVLGIILPFLFKTGLELFSFGTFLLISCVVIINTLFDLSYLHDGRKIGYYLSKPVTLRRKLNVSLIVNLLFSLIVIFSFLISSIVCDIIEENQIFTFFSESNYLVFVVYAWLIAGIFILTLSAEICGNTIVSFIVGIFIFSLPAIIYLLASYIFYIFDSVIVGINSGLVVQEIVFEKLIPLYEIYFLDYVGQKIDIFYLLRLLFICAIIYIFILVFEKNRRNEKVGKLIVNSGFKYFMALFASMIAPMLLSIVMDKSNLIQLVTTLVILSGLSYYILIAIFDKTFKISINAIKIYIPFIILVVISIYLVSHILNIRANVIPEKEYIVGVSISRDVEYISNAKYLEDVENPKSTVILYEKIENIKGKNGIIFLEEENSIDKVRKLHKSLMKYNLQYKKNNNYFKNISYEDKSIKIIYFLKDGKKMVREYVMPNSSENRNSLVLSVNENIMDLAIEEEYIKEKFSIFLDKNIINELENYEILGLWEDKYELKNKVSYSKIAELFIDDYKIFMSNKKNAYYLDNSFLCINYGNNSFDICTDDLNKYIYFEFRSNLVPYRINVGKLYNLKKYLESITN